MLPFYKLLGYNQYLPVYYFIYTVNFYVDFYFLISRDIPMPLVTSGVEHGNLRELALARMKDLGTQCRDVRTREVGIQEIHHKVQPYEVRIINTELKQNQNGLNGFIIFYFNIIYLYIIIQLVSKIGPILVH